MTELSVGTKKGLFVLEGEPGAEFSVRGRAFAGEPVEYALRDQRSGRLLASVTSAFYGPKIFYTDDPAGDWEQAEGIALPDGGDQALERIWVIVPGEEDGLLYAGGDPGVLFTSRDGGESWELNEALWRHRVEEDWQPGGGGLCLRVAHRRRRPDVAARQQRARAALHAGGGPRDDQPALRAQPLPLAARTGEAVHAVPRRRLPLRRCGRQLDRHRRGPAV
jgi:hypothetical protein